MTGSIRKRDTTSSDDSGPKYKLARILRKKIEEENRN